MKIYEEKELKDFDFWSGGADRAANLTDEDFDSVEQLFEELYPDGMSDTEINDFFWFEFDEIAKHLGYEDEEYFDRKRDPFYLDDDDLEEYIDDYWREYLDEVCEEQGEEGLKFIIEELFGEDVDTVLESYKDEAYDKSPMGVYYHFLASQDSSELMETLFDNDQGWGVLDNFSTKEEFREEMMDDNKIRFAKQ